MSHGLRTWNANGALELDTNTFTYQVLGQWVIDFSNSTPQNPGIVTLNIPGFDPSTCALILLPTRAQDIYYPDGTKTNAKCYPYVTVSASQAVVRSVYPGASSTSNAVATCRAILRAIAIRYA